MRDSERKRLTVDWSGCHHMCRPEVRTRLYPLVFTRRNPVGAPSEFAGLGHWLANYRSWTSSLELGVFTSSGRAWQARQADSQERILVAPHFPARRAWPRSCRTAGRIVLFSPARREFGSNDHNAGTGSGGRKTARRIGGVDYSAGMRT